MSAADSNAGSAERSRVNSAYGLSAAEAPYRELLDNANDIIYTHDLQGNFTYVNEAAKAMLGPFLPGGPDSLVGSTLQAVFAPLAALAGQLADPARSPVRLKMPFGALTIDLQVVAIRNKEGVHTGGMAVWSDVTAQIRLGARGEGGGHGLRLRLETD